ncbi:MAG: sensor histidine kinase [Bacteroidota bacterium]
MKNKSPNLDANFLIEVIHNFVRFTASAVTAQEVFWAITKNFMQTLQIEDCVVYESFPHRRKIIQRAAHGAKNPNGDIINNLLELDFGVGIAGWVAEHQETVCIGDAREDFRYIVDDEPRLSELSVPIQFNGELFGVIDSENSEANFFTTQHVYLFELIADLAANLLVRIRQKEELELLKIELEALLNEKRQALEEAIETVSGQSSELKIQEEKQELLIKEVHHRVNNNLQILNSIIRIYLMETENVTVDTLREIQQKIQTLSAIHLILLKSVENNKTGVEDFLHDLIASIRYTSDSNYLLINAQSAVTSLPINTLIPLGLLINEIATSAINTHWEKGEAVELNIRLEEEGERICMELHTGKKIDPEKSIVSGSVNEILVEALIQQLEGDKLDPEGPNAIRKIIFNRVD